MYVTECLYSIFIHPSLSNLHINTIISFISHISNVDSKSIRNSIIRKILKFHHEFMILIKPVAKVISHFNMIFYITIQKSQQSSRETITITINRNFLTHKPLLKMHIFIFNKHRINVLISLLIHQINKYIINLFK